MAAADVAPSALVATQLDRIVSGVSRQIDASMRRHFYPVTETRVFYPDFDTDPDTHLSSFAVTDLLSASAVTVDDVALTSADYRFTDLGDNAAPYQTVALVNTVGDKVEITGEWGYSDDTVAAGEMASTANASVTQILVTDSAAVGVGDLILVSEERMRVVGKGMADTDNNLSADLDAVHSSTTVGVTTGSDYHPGEIILIDSERMQIVEIVGNNAIVERAVQGSVLAAHTAGADIFAPRSLTVERGATGSTATVQGEGAAISRFVAPPPIRSLCLAEALVAYEQEKGAYGRVVGSGEGQREASGKGLADVRRRAMTFRRTRWAAI